MFTVPPASWTAAVLIDAYPFSPAGRVDFILPATTAEVSLETFAEQAAAQVVYLLEDVRGVTTHPVAGDFTPGEALDPMLAAPR